MRLNNTLKEQIANARTPEQYRLEHMGVPYTSEEPSMRQPMPTTAPTPPPPIDDDRPYSVRLAKWIKQTQDRSKPCA